MLIRLSARLISALLLALLAVAALDAGPGATPEGLALLMI
jgi:hypothetical protein